MAVSALTRENVKDVLWKALELLQKAPAPAVEDSMPVYRPGEDPRAFTIEQTPEGWVVHSRALERSAAMTYFEHEGSARRFQKLIASLGVEKALREAGVQEGDNVIIGDTELEWSD